MKSNTLTGFVLHEEVSPVLECDGWGLEPRGEKRDAGRPLRLVGVLDLMGGKPGCAFGDGAVSPTPTRGRASTSDVRAVVIEEG